MPLSMCLWRIEGEWDEVVVVVLGMKTAMSVRHGWRWGNGSITPIRLMPEVARGGPRDS